MPFLDLTARLAEVLRRTPWLGRLAAVVLAAASAVSVGPPAGNAAVTNAGQPDPASRPDRGGHVPGDGPRQPRGRPPRTGLLRHETGAFEGYTLFAPHRSTITYLIDMEGTVVHTWESDYTPGYAVYLLANGHLLRCGREPGEWAFNVAGLGGRIQEIDWDGNVVWEFVYAGQDRMQHHDIEPLPSGNVLLIAWERKTEAEAIAAGCDPELLVEGELWPDHILEIKPTRPRGGTVVWKWHVWDHLVQDRDPTKANFGSVAEHPELVNVNLAGASVGLPAKERRRLEALGYIGSSPTTRVRAGKPDWNHINAVAYNAQFDQIALSVLRFNEIWVIDHSTTTAEAAGHTGGKYGKGGDILYRWGNPQASGAGTAEDQQLFAQHDVHWIAPGLPGAGNFLLFNNGQRRPQGNYSSVEEIIPTVDAHGRYVPGRSGGYGPSKPTWRYTSPRKTDFFSGHVSGAQRLPNGNTLICSGDRGRFLEVDPNGKTVWEYINPFEGEPKPPGDGRSHPGPPRGKSNAVFRATRLAPDQPWSRALGR